MKKEEKYKRKKSNGEQRMRNRKLENKKYKKKTIL